MTDDRDPLEAELAALRPQPVSPRLEGLVAGRLARPTAPPPWHRVRWPVALAGALAAAACVVAGLALYRASPGGPGRGDVAVTPAPAPAPPAAEEQRPTLAAYRRAFAESPEAFDALLDRQAARAPAADPPPRPLHAFALSDPDLLD